ncbi:MAG: hypothetical protein NTZ67_08320 [Gammaproteobacteria bacterium]|nr:hypothetical protein [Gammaproteobacteria bacterium]
MNSITRELQKESLRTDTSISDLLLKALLVSRKLKLNELKIWIENELSGYKNTDELPFYRITQCQIRMYNPYHGWGPVLFSTKEQEKTFNRTHIMQSISEIESLRKKIDEKDHGYISMLLSSEQILMIQKMTSSDFPVECLVPSTTIDKVCESVRKIILDWSLTLEEQGILGEDMSFTDKEKEKVGDIHQYTINFHGILGNVNNSKVDQNFDFSVNENDLSSLISALEELQIEKSDIIALSEAIKSDKKPASKKTFGKNVSAWIGRITSKAAEGAYHVSVDVLTGIISKLITNYYGF